ncbi:MAG: hypothetical protein H7A51_18890 [Akkermansiaceae bacterium]|nr:hypothetical protein [Akkermansiaceae bacterium]
MKTPSIKKRLLISIVLLIVTMLGIGSTGLYLKVRQSHYEQIDIDLQKIAELLAIEIEVNDGKVIYEWLDELDTHPGKNQKDYIQSWDAQGNNPGRSPDLEEMDLPFFHGELNEYVYRDVTLPEGRRGRAVGLLLIPSLSEEDASEHEKTTFTPPPHVLVVAIDIEHSARRLAKLRWAFALTTIGLILATSMVISFIINNSLQPIKDLALQVSDALPENSGTAFHIAPNFPLELRELVSHYNKLIERIDLARTRERDFSANAAHELRTPLTGISTTLELALSKPRDNPYYVNSITRTLDISSSMQLLLERLMSFAKLQNDAYPLTTTTVDIQGILKQSWEEQKEKANARELAVLWSLDPTATTVDTDKQLFHILVRNLINNAVSYAKASTTITIITQRLNGHIALRITNETTGLNASDTEKFFDPFFRLDAARGMSENHYGIGLALCREISRVLGGRISAKLDEDMVISIEFIFD